MATGPWRRMPETHLKAAASQLRADGYGDLANKIDPPRAWEACFCVDVKTSAHVNEHKHWRHSHRDATKEKQATMAAWVSAGCPRPPSHPVHFRFTRIAPRPLDWDNLPTAPKFIQDELCRLIGLARANGQARDEGDKVIVHHHQERGAPKTYGVRVEMWTEGGGDGST